LRLPAVDALAWGPQLRFSSPPRLIEEFYQQQEAGLPPFILYGSGDFHHLSALWIRRVSEPVVVVSFDNHPDWDLRPPKWCCGSWVNRALELSQVRRVSVWGCGNFECWWPAQIFGNRRAEGSGRLEVHPWADDRNEHERRRRGAILRENWRARFKEFVENLGSVVLYVTIDLDCLCAEEAVTSWESGRFSVADVIWALETLRGRNRIAGGDICGAYSAPRYARWKQKFASEMDHPKLSRPDPEKTRRINHASFRALWPALTE
jgi:arginase family enzyme